MSLSQDEQEDDEEIENSNEDTGHLTGRVKIVPNMPLSETDMTSTGLIRDEDPHMFTQVHGANQEDARSVITTSSMGSYQTSITLRRARVAKPEEKMAHELSKQVINEMKKQIQER